MVRSAEYVQSVPEGTPTISPPVVQWNELIQNIFGFARCRITATEWWKIEILVRWWSSASLPTCSESPTPPPPPVRVFPLHRWMDESFVNSYLIVADGKKGFASGNHEILGLWGMWSHGPWHGSEISFWTVVGMCNSNKKFIDSRGNSFCKYLHRIDPFQLLAFPQLYLHVWPAPPSW